MIFYDDENTYLGEIYIYYALRQLALPHSLRLLGDCWKCLSDAKGVCFLGIQASCGPCAVPPCNH